MSTSIRNRRIGDAAGSRGVATFMREVRISVPGILPPHGIWEKLTRAVTTVGVCDDRIHSVAALVLDRKLWGDGMRSDRSRRDS